MITTTSFFSDRRVAVTGAAGTVGEELVRQLLRCRVREVRALDNNESALFFMGETYREDNRFQPFLSDVRDGAKMERMFDGIDLVFHAAAFKHVPLCERSPFDAVQTNIIGAKFFRNALRGEPLEIYGDGSQTRDFIYIDALINAILLAAHLDIGGEVFQIATHKETTVIRIAELIKRVVESEIGREVLIVHSGTRPGDVKRNYSDISKAKKFWASNPYMISLRG